MHRPKPPDPTPRPHGDPAAPIDILPAGWRRRRRRWCAEGVALLRRASRVQPPQDLEPCLRADLRERLLVLMEALDARLHEPPAIDDDGRRRIVTVLGTVTFGIHRRRYLVGRVVAPPEGGVALAETFDLRRPMADGRWLAPVLATLGLAAAGPQGALFDGDAARAARDAWLAAAAQRLLARDARFRALRGAVRDALALDPDLLRLTLRARLRRDAPADATLYARLWRARDGFEQVERRAPHLLPLAALLHEATGVDPGREPLRRCRDAFLQLVHPHPASWRWCARHGARALRVALDAVESAARPLTVLAGYLDVIKAAGYPPPPSPALARALVLAGGAPGADNPWPDLSDATWPALLATDARLRGTPEHPAFLRDARIVCRWSRYTLFESLFDSLTRPEPRDWGAIRRAARAWANDDAEGRANAERGPWSFPFPAVNVRGCLVVPLLTPWALADEADAMANCAEDYIEGCDAGEYRFFSVRDAQSGRRLATLSVQRTPAGWVFHDMRKRANRPVDAHLARVGRAVARVFAKVVGRGEE